jgi:hypothetical protein
LATGWKADPTAVIYSPHLLARGRPFFEAIADNGVLRLSFPVTVAGLFRNCTGFPILPGASDAGPPVTA